MSPAAPAATAAASAACKVVRDLTYCKNNITIIFYDGVIRKPKDCTLEKCSLLVSHWGYLPNIPGNAFFMALLPRMRIQWIAILAIPMGVWKRTWGCLFGLTIGCAFEAVGTLGRIQAAKDPFAFNPFLLYIIFQTIGPAFLSAAIYLCLARIMVVYGEGNARWKPRTYSLAFMFSDLVALILQGGGGGVAATAKDDMDKAQLGINVMIAGLVWQVASLTLFAAAAGDFWWCVKHGRGASDSRFFHLRSKRRWTGFLWALSAATILIYLRSIYRVAELVQGFTGKIADHEPSYMIFEPLMIVASCILLVAWHPSYVFGDMWSQADYRQTASKDTTLEKGNNPNDDASEITSEKEKKSLKVKIFGRSKSEDRKSLRNRWSGPIMHQPGCPNRREAGHHQHQHQQHAATAYYQSGGEIEAQYAHRGPNLAHDPNIRTPLLTSHHQGDDDHRRPSDSSTYSNNTYHPRSASITIPHRPSTAYGRGPQTAVYPPPRPQRDSNAYINVRKPSESSQTSQTSQTSQVRGAHDHNQWHPQNWTSGSNALGGPGPQSARPQVDERHAERWVNAHHQFQGSSSAAGQYPRSATLAPRTPFGREGKGEW